MSASRYAHKARTDWPKLLDDVQHDRAGIIWLWESSRGERRASTWLALLEDCRDHGTRIYVETHGRLYDMANPRDWRTLAEDGTDSEYESAQDLAAVSPGRPPARAAAGQAGRARSALRVHPPLRAGRTDREADRARRQEPHPDEAPIVVEIIGSRGRG